MILQVLTKKKLYIYYINIWFVGLFKEKNIKKTAFLFEIGTGS